MKTLWFVGVLQRYHPSMPRSNYFDHACAEAGLSFRQVRSTWGAAGRGDVEAKALIAMWRNDWPKLVTVFNLLERIDQSQKADVLGRAPKRRPGNVLIQLRDQSNSKGSARPIEGGAPGLGKRR